jgi:hypothetical protein
VGGVCKYLTLHSILGKQLYKNLHPAIQLHFQKKLEETVIMLANIQETLLVKSSIVTSFKLQQGCEVSFIGNILYRQKDETVIH